VKRPDPEELSGEALVKETNRLIRLARSYWDAHNNLACRTERDRALALYNRLSKEEKDKIPQELRVWLRYRSEKYFGPGRTAPGTKGKKRPASHPSAKPKKKPTKPDPRS
jgi:hypothetical protein